MGSCQILPAHGRAGVAELCASLKAISQSQGEVQYCSQWSYNRGEIIIRWVSDLLIGTGRSKEGIMIRQEMGRRNKQDKHKMS